MGGGGLIGISPRASKWLETALIAIVDTETDKNLLNFYFSE